MPWPRRVLLAITFVGFSQGVSPADDVLARVMQEYPAALANLDRLLSQVHGKGNRQVTIPLGSGAERIISEEFVLTFDGERQKFEGVLRDTSPQQSGGFDEVLCQGDRYAFLLRRPDAKRPFTVQSFAPGVSVGSKESLSDKVGTYVYAPCAIEGERLVSLMARPTFRFTKAEPEGPGSARIRVHFEDTDPKARIFAGWVLLNPAAGWRMEQSESYFHPSRKRPFRCTIDYPPGDGSVFPRVVDVQEPSGKRRLFTFETLESHVASPTDFTLSAYGLPEMDVVPQGRGDGRAVYWLFGLAFVCLVGAVGLRYRSRQRQGS